MFRSKRWTFSVVALVLAMSSATAQRIVPSPLLAIDQNRTTVVERVVGQWGDALYASNAGIGGAELRQMLSGMRSDHLLAASLAGTLDGLRDVMAKALIATADGKATIWSTPRWCRAASSIRATPAARCSPESPEPSSATTPAALWCKAGWPPTAGCQTAWRRSR